MKVPALAPRWRKAGRDLADQPGRAALAVLAMAAGAFGVTVILTGYAILARELAGTYADTRPASAILVGAAGDDAQVEAVRRLPGVADAEARPIFRGRVRVGPDEWAPLLVFVIRDFGDIRLDRFRPDQGAWPPAAGEVLLERTALSVARAGIGDTVSVKAAGGAPIALRIAGTVHAGGLAPSWMDHVVIGFVGPRSVLRADGHGETPQIRILVAERADDPSHIREVAARVKEWLEARGGTVSRVEVPPPGRHPHADQMDTFLFLLGAFGALTFVLGTVLAASTVHALLTRQVKQIGVMKAIGATTRQIVGLYLAQVGALAALALVIALPLGVWAGRGYADFSAAILNASIVSGRVPWWVPALETAAGLLVPMVVALLPIARAARIPVHEALRDDGGGHAFGTRALDRWLSRIDLLPRPLRLGLRTAFHRRGRLALTVGMLAAGGAAFVAALNVAAAWSRAVAVDAEGRRYDLDVRLAQPYPVARVAEAVATVPSVTAAEYWPEVSALLVEPGGATEPVGLLGPGADTRLLALPLSSGRWLVSADQNGVVVNQAVPARLPSVRVGSDLVLRIRSRDLSWHVVGIVHELYPGPMVYAMPRPVAAAAGPPDDRTRSVRAVTRGHDLAATLAAARALERALESAGLEVSLTQRLLDRRQAFEDHLVIVKSALILAAGLVVVVGALGLTSTLTLSVLERTREIGILAALGASPRAIAAQVVIEGLVIGVSSWIVALIASVPISIALDSVTGQIFVKGPIPLVLSPAAAAAWLALLAVLVSLCSFHPARRAARLPVREALIHE
ncbi:MAG TPA: FtsX-like permease family protein [Vicinamibacteria bacterium]|nr:FtsX-like permease family protein [Vicinamibacteria bacterium]